MDASPLTSIGSWIAAHPLLAVGLAFALPIALLVASELLPRSGERIWYEDEPPAEPPGEDTTEVRPRGGAVTEARPVERTQEVATSAPEAAPPERAAPAAPAPAVAEPEVAEPRVAEPAPAPPPARLRDRLRLTSEALVGRVGSLLGGRRVDAELIEELEVLLLGADLGVRTADDLLGRVRREASGGDAERVRAVLRDAVREKLRRVDPGAAGWLAIGDTPHVILVLGVNGSGKTTTIGKLAARHVAEGRRVVLGAADTFRAAAIEQLQVWGERVGCEVVAGQAGGDPSSVAFDTVKAATARGADVAIVDTAGRLQTKKPLMEELSKLARVIGKCREGAPHETLLVLDANTGQNAISQARLFTEAAPVTGLVLTKLDGTAKGGVLLGLADEFGIPVKYVGVGESVADLRDFDAEEFVEALGLS